MSVALGDGNSELVSKIPSLNDSPKAHSFCNRYRGGELRQFMMRRYSISILTVAHS